MRLFDQAKYAFIRRRHRAYGFSAALILVGIGGMIFNVSSIGSWQDYGVDFTGGSLIQVQFHETATAGQLRAALGGSQAPAITRFGEENEFMIRAALGNDDVQTVGGIIQNQLQAAFGNDGFTILKTEAVSPKVGEELQRNALLAILYSFVLTLIYIAFRFELRFGLAAVIATAHDILITLGFLAIFRIEIALPTVAAILTIVGYSLNDTIVVFDRIRENLRGREKLNYAELVNRSINQTLSRTVLTSFTTFVALFALFLAGVSVIRDFSFAMMIGVVVGTYSSIFIASPVLIFLRKREVAAEEREKAQVAKS